MLNLVSAMNTEDITQLIAMALIMMVPIVAILARHQQKMAMILRQPQTGRNDEAIIQLATEVQQLKTMMTEQALAMDNLAETNRKLTKRLEGTDASDRVTV